jgi:CHAD domain-containing protein
MNAMKSALELHFGSVTNVASAERYVVRVRFAEVLQRQAALEGDDDMLHAFRLACKRLRFALERLHEQPPEMRRAQKLIAQLTEELGGAHDCARLEALARKNGAPLTAARAQRDRDRYVDRAKRLWRQAFRSAGEFSALAQYAGFRWSGS